MLAINIPQQASADQYGDRVTAWFAPEVVALPPDSSSALLSSIQIDPGDLYTLLASYQVESMSRTFPSAVADDTLATAPTGETIRLPDFSRVYTLHVTYDRDIDSLIADLSQRPEIILAEREGYPVFQAAYPSDSLFARGDQYALNNFGQNSGVPGKDIKATQAWSLCKGDSTVLVGIADNGVTNAHPDLAGRVTDLSGGVWDNFSDKKGHGFMVAGVLGANSNNARGVAGVDWYARLVSRNIDNTGAVDPDSISAKNGIYALLSAGTSVINNSYTMRDKSGQYADGSLVLEAAMLSARNSGCVIVAGMGNKDTYNTHPIEYPAAYPHVIAVGATDRNGDWWPDSETGNHIDVVAPGVAIRTTTPFDSFYVYQQGTSFATPMVSGVASLMFARAKALGLKLYPEDVEHLIPLAADDIPPTGFDTATGWGQVNARRSLEFLARPHILKRAVATTGGHVVGTATVDSLLIVGLGKLRFLTRYTVRQHLDFTADTTGGAFQNASNISVWARAVDTSGWPDADASTVFIGGGQDFTVVANTMSTSGCDVVSYVYYDPSTGNYYGAQPQFMHNAWTAFEKRPSSVPDSTQSFFVPQADSTGGIVLEGHDATRYFRTCPNNDGSMTFPKGARVQVTVRDANGIGIQGIAASDIYMLVSGGTKAQGFNNEGADSVLSSSKFNHSCPDLRTIYADAPTDANGVTRITFTGVPDAQGNKVRDPGRKWGHYDSDIPVYALGQRVLGKMTSSSPLGSYSLQIKNVDFVGLGGSIVEQVNISDLNELIHWKNLPYSYSTHWWADFDSDGQVNLGDEDMLLNHLLHACGSPNSQ